MIKSFWAESYPCCVPGMFVNYVTNTQAENSVHKLLCELCERGKTECRQLGVDSERNTVVWSGFTRKHGRLKHSKGWQVALMEYVKVFGVTDMCRWLQSSLKPANAVFIKRLSDVSHFHRNSCGRRPSFAGHTLIRSIIQKLGMLRSVEVCGSLHKV